MHGNTAARLALLCSLALAGTAQACGGEPAAEREAGAAALPARVDAPEPMPEPEALAAPLEALRARVDALVAASPERPADEAAIDRLRETAAMLRVLSLREGTPDALGRARELLALAAGAGASPASCRAQADRVRLEALDAVDLPRAAALAHEGVQRFGASPEAALCASRLADASRALSAVGGSGASAALLSRITVYGADAAAPTGVRVLFELDREVAPESIERPAAGGAPRRLWLDFAGVEAGPGLPEAVDVNAGGLVRLRRTELAGTSTRVELELDPRAVVRRFSLDRPWRHVVDVSLPPASAPVGAAAAGARPIRRVVLDPGHGGDEWGASSGGVRESHLVFDIARRAAAALSARLPALEVLLTRDDDVLVTLERRTELANEAEADLFVSIHLNDSDVAIERGGVTTFVLDTTEDRQALRLAARENGTTPAEVSGMTRLLAELHRSGQVDASRALAERIHAATLGRGRTILPGLADRGVRSALFYVLVGARMPAVLVEASFISHPDELRALRTTGYRQALAEGIAEGIAAYVLGE